MSTTTKTKTIIFDFDGTLANSYALIINHISDSEKVLGKMLTRENIDRFKKVGIDRVLKDLKISKFRLIQIMLKLHNLFSKYINEVELYPGTLEMLSDLKNKGYTLGILTSNSKSNVIKFLTQNDLVFMFDFVDSDISLFSKAQKLNNLIAKRKLDRNYVIFVGDEARDIKAGNIAGIKTVAVTWGYNSEELLLNEMPSAIAQNNRDLTSILLKA